MFWWNSDHRHVVTIFEASSTPQVKRKQHITPFPTNNTPYPITFQRCCTTPVLSALATNVGAHALFLTSPGSAHAIHARRSRSSSPLIRWHAKAPLSPRLVFRRQDVSSPHTSRAYRAALTRGDRAIVPSSTSLLLCATGVTAYLPQGSSVSLDDGRVRLVAVSMRQR